MIKHEINCVLNEYNSKELDKNQKNLLQKAHQICSDAYAPYSKFKVGASLILKNGQIISGSNQENVAYPSGLCANQIIEQVAIVAQADFELNNPIMPCGACRQTMIEYEQKQGQNIEVLIQGNKGNIYVSESVSNLLPYAFECEELKK